MANDFTIADARRAINESNDRWAEKKQKALKEAKEARENQIKYRNSIIEGRIQKERQHGALMEACRNDAFGKALKAIYITALEPGSLTNNGIALAESMVDNWITENGGASKILSSTRQRDSYLLSRIAQIVEAAAILETEEAEKAESDNGDTSFEEGKLEDDKKAEESTAEEGGNTEVELATKIIEKNVDTSDPEVAKALELIKSKSSNSAESETKEDDDKSDDTLNDTFDDDNDESEKDDEKESKDEKKTEDDDDESEKDDEKESKDEKKTEDDDDEKESEDDDDESEKDDEKESKDEKKTEDDDDEKESEDDDKSDDTLNDTFEDEDEDESEKDVEVPDDATTDEDDNETDIADDITDDLEEVPEDDITIDGDKDSRGKVFSELEKEEDVKKAIELIRQRVADAEENFIKKNAEDKKQIDELIGRISDNVKTVENIGDSDDTKSKIAQEAAMMNRRKIHNITENKPLTILEKMCRNLQAGITKDEVLREQYMTESGNIDTGLIVESAKVMYAFLETINTLKLEKVDADYITNVLDNM